jgi:energy-converting hydrogenase Eha subunit H
LRNFGVLRRALLTVTAVVLTVGVVAPAVAIAAPATAASQSADTSTPDERVRALAVLGVTATPGNLVLPERSFVFLLWQTTVDHDEFGEIYDAALVAYDGTESDWTQFIRTGIYQAHERDLENARIARELREVKQRAAAVIGVVATPGMLVTDEKNFIFSLWQLATGIENAEVKTAALAAFQGTAADQASFLRAGIFEAHQRDVQAGIDRAAEEAKKAAEAKRHYEIRTKAAAVIGVGPTDAVIVLSDENFVLFIAQHASAGSEVEYQAWRALRAGTADAYRVFIETGIHEAAAIDG